MFHQPLVYWCPDLCKRVGRYCIPFLHIYIYVYIYQHPLQPTPRNGLFQPVGPPSLAVGVRLHLFGRLAPQLQLGTGLLGRPGHQTHFASQRETADAAISMEILMIDHFECFTVLPGVWVHSQRTFDMIYNKITIPLPCNTIIETASFGVPCPWSFEIVAL